MYSKLPVEIEAEKGEVEAEIPVAMETEQDASADEEIEDEGIEVCTGLDILLPACDYPLLHNDSVI